MGMGIVIREWDRRAMKNPINLFPHISATDHGSNCAVNYAIPPHCVFKAGVVQSSICKSTLLYRV